VAVMQAVDESLRQNGVPVLVEDVVSARSEYEPESSIR
jgi:hypothetical protein